MSRLSFIAGMALSLTPLDIDTRQPVGGHGQSPTQSPADRIHLVGASFGAVRIDGDPLP
jgi:hypothetical protein